jgi:hypothetical protein
MELKNRFGAFMLFIGAIFLFIFYSSLFTPNQAYNFGALLLGGFLVFTGWNWYRGRKPAPPPPPPPPKPAAPAAKAKPPGLLTTILKGPAKKPAAAPPPPPAAPPPPPKKGLAALFSPKPKKK